MALKHGTFPWASRATAGTLNYKNLYSNTFGYTQTHKKVAAGSSTAILAATSGSASSQTVTSGITQPDVPRALSVTPTVNATNSPLSVVVTGTNVEGKTITESFIIAKNSTSAVNGAKAFFSVTSVFIPGNTAGLTITVGTQNALGTNHRLFNQNTTVKVYSATTVGGALTIQAQPTVVAHEVEIERNLVTPATTPGGTTFLIMAYAYDNWSDGTTLNDAPEYSTTTSTSSTSTSTSTTTVTTSTSTSSTSTSITTTSSTSTSTSTSSTSTSTTTAP